MQETHQNAMTLHLHRACNLKANKVDVVLLYIKNNKVTLLAVLLNLIYTGRSIC